MTHMQFGQYGRATRGCQKGLCLNKATRLAAFWVAIDGKRCLEPMLACAHHGAHTVQQLPRGEVRRASVHNKANAWWHDDYIGVGRSRG